MTQLAEETLTLAPDTPTLEEQAPETDTAEASIEDGDTGESTEDTRDVAAEIEAAREEGRKAAREELETANLLRAHQERVRSDNEWLARTGAKEVRQVVEYFVRKVEAGEMTAADALNQINEDNLARGTGQRMASAYMTNQLQAMDELQEMWLKKDYPDWRIPTELVRQRDLARSRGDTPGMLAANREIERRAIRENDLPKELVKEREAEKAKTKSAAQVAQTKAGDTAKANAPGPTKTTGATVGRMTRARLDSIPDSAWLSYPKEQREQWLREAAEDDARRR